MTDPAAYLQRQTEDEVHLPRLLRVALAVVLLVGGGSFMVFGTALSLNLEQPTGQKPMTVLVLMALLVAPGFSFMYVGWRLLRIRKHTEHLFTRRSGRIASYCIIVVGVLMLVVSWFVSHIEYAAAGLFSLLMADWLFRSTKSIGPDGDGN